MRPKALQVSKIVVSPQFAATQTITETLQSAKIKAIENIGGADLEIMSGDREVLVITFAKKKDRTAFIKAVKEIQKGIAK